MWIIYYILLLCISSLVRAVVTPFVLDGGLDSATASGTEYNSGGTISVNGYSITVPQNLQVQFPAAFVPFIKFASGGFTGHEVSVTGNVVDGKAIAGLISIAQFQLQAGTGVVASVNFDGTLGIVGGSTIRVDDPNGVFGAKYDTNPFYTADDENPSVTAFSGFPMCIPRSSDDEKCPSSNRPAGKNTFSAPDSLFMAPFKVGDYVEYSGVKVGDQIVCYEIVAPSVQITTSGAPTYVRVEDALVGVYDGGATSEFADTRFIGYSSDPSAAITVYAIDVDPCTGAETERSVGAASYKAGDVRNKWTWRSDSTTFSKYTREYVIRSSTGEKTTADGIIAGKYVQPVTEWIFPEANVPGIIPSVNDFSQFTYLAHGLGRDEDGQLWGQLNPWPGANAPAATSCAPASSTPSATSSAADATGSTGPVVTATLLVAAGSTQTVRPGILGTLKATVSNSDSFPQGDLLYNWTQISGPAIKLSGTTVVLPSFTAPAAAAKATCVFFVNVTSKAAGTYNSTSFAIINDPSVKDVVSIDSYTYTSQQGGTLSVTASSNIIDGSMTMMQLYLQNTVGGTALTMTHTGGGKFSYSARSTKKPATGVSVQSGAGGTSSRSATSARRRRVI
ncbi:hypothetical protein AAFC00_006500 [Neodothiora populina]|uniref:Uncharacterized protein n=1 Tax=Neodothiora populina TaxID=2781224 RepID=A0ABR3P5Q3_9PEZI